MDEELREAILGECIKQHDFHSLKDDTEFAVADFKMALLDMEGGHDKELFKLSLKHGLRKDEYDGNGRRK